LPFDFFYGICGALRLSDLRIRGTTQVLTQQEHALAGVRRGPIAPILATFLLLIGAVPILVTAVVVWGVLGRPLIFKQERTGLGKRTFVIRKFRTMREIRDATGMLLPDEIRSTPITRFIRRIRADELPQLFAIARGEMAFVGPRPLLPTVVDEFGELGALRCSVRPGLTGWAQVNGNTQLSDAQKLALDVWYIDHRSLLLDMSIIVRTIVVMIRGEKVRPRIIALAEANLAQREHRFVTPTMA
jgi:lipopolysaccharide/colanic/teichoic acid biosynthesis glycosyltransferase